MIELRMPPESRWSLSKRECQVLAALIIAAVLVTLLDELRLVRWELWIVRRRMAQIENGLEAAQAGETRPDVESGPG